MPTVEPVALSHVSLKVTDLARSAGWWKVHFGYDVFLDGVAPTPDRTRHCIGLVGGAGGVALELLETPGGQPRGPETLGLVGVSLSVGHIADALAALKGAGEAVGSRVIEAAVWKVAFLTDPDGNIVELVQQPPGARTLADTAGLFAGR